MSQVFEIVDSDFVVDTGRVIDTFRELLPVGDMHEIRKRFEERTGCEYVYDEQSIVHSVAKLDDVDIYEEDAIDTVVCRFDDYVAEMHIKMLRLVASRENTFQLLSIRYIQCASVRIYREQ